jgi:hypothetical protein
MNVNAASARLAPCFIFFYTHRTLSAPFALQTLPPWMSWALGRAAFRPVGEAVQPTICSVGITAL